MDLDSALTGKPAEGAGALEILREDHAEIRRLAAKYRDAGAEPHARRVLAESVFMQAELHARIEDEVFYPAVRRLAPDVVDRLQRGHDAIARGIDVLENSDPAAPEHAPAAEQVIADLLQHLEEEERDLFPRVERGMAAEMRDLGAALTECKTRLTRSTEDFEGPAT